MDNSTELRDALQAPELLLAPEGLLREEGPATGMALHIVHGKIGAVGPLAEVQARCPHLAPIALPRRLVMPGFIDAHHHLTQSFGKALAFGEPSEIFRRIWVPLEGSLDERCLYLAAKLASLEALRGGFTTVCDAGTRAKGGLASVADATRDAGIRCVLGLTCNDAGMSDAERAELNATAQRHLTAFGGHPLVHPSLAISTPEAASDAQLHHIASMSAEAGVVFQIHVNEHLASVERSLVARGQRPMEHMAAVGALGPQTLVAHATLVTAHELMLMRDSDTAVAFNPVASVWKGNAVANAPLMAELGIRFGMGTDGTRSDGFRLLDSAETVTRLAHGLAIGDSSAGAGWLWLDHATHGGADAAGIARTTGRIAAGQAADLLLLDMDVPELCPSWDQGWELVRLAARDQIEAVFVAGRMRLWKGWPLDWDGRALLDEVRATAQTAIANAPIHKVHPTSAVHRAARKTGV